MCLASEKKMKIVMASLDDAGKTTILYRLEVDTAVTEIPTTSFNVERVRHRILELTVRDTEDRKASDEIEFLGKTASSEKSPFQNASRKSESIRNCGVPIDVYGSERRDPRGQRGME